MTTGSSMRALANSGGGNTEDQTWHRLTDSLHETSKSHISHRQRSKKEPQHMTSEGIC